MSTSIYYVTSTTIDQCSINGLIWLCELDNNFKINNNCYDFDCHQGLVKRLTRHFLQSDYVWKKNIYYFLTKLLFNLLSCIIKETMNLEGYLTLNYLKILKGKKFEKKE